METYAWVVTGLVVVAAVVIAAFVFRKRLHIKDAADALTKK